MALALTSWSGEGLLNLDVTCQRGSHALRGDPFSRRARKDGRSLAAWWMIRDLAPGKSLGASNCELPGRLGRPHRCVEGVSVKVRRSHRPTHRSRTVGGKVRKRWVLNASEQPQHDGFLRRRQSPGFLHPIEGGWRSPPSVPKPVGLWAQLRLPELNTRLQELVSDRRAQDVAPNGLPESIRWGARLESACVFFAPHFQ